MARGWRARADAIPTDLPSTWVEGTILDGDRATPIGRARWLDPPFSPPLDDCDQSYGICFDPLGRIALVWDGSMWTLPGGGVEPGETLEGTLAREVAEEISARVIEYEYIGCQLIDDLRDPERAPFYQARFWARIEPEALPPTAERLEHRFVEPSEFQGTLGWETTEIVRRMFDNALAVERSRPHPRSSGTSE